MKRFNHLQLLAALISIASISLLTSAQTHIDDNDAVYRHLKQSNASPYPLVQIDSCDPQKTHPHHADLNIASQGPDLIIQGHDFANNTWTAQITVTGLGCEVFQADLDGNGHPDLIIYAPSIGDRGSYGTRLTVLLFDKQDEPFPWEATGRFTRVNGGIQEIFQDSKGVGIIQTQKIGLAAWDGFSYLSYFYRVANSRISLANESYARIKFPYIVKANKADTRIQRTADKINLSTAAVAQDIASPVRNTEAQAMKYGADTTISPSKNSASAALANQPILNPTIDISASSLEEQIILSDGSKLDLPTILVIDQADKTRKIIFHPEASDFEPLTLSRGKYRIHQTGTDCPGLDACQPFILWAK